MGHGEDLNVVGEPKGRALFRATEDGVLAQLWLDAELLLIAERKEERIGVFLELLCRFPLGCGAGTESEAGVCFHEHESGSLVIAIGMEVLRCQAVFGPLVE